MHKCGTTAMMIALGAIIVACSPLGCSTGADDEESTEEPGRLADSPEASEPNEALEEVLGTEYEMVGDGVELGDWTFVRVHHPDRSPAPLEGYAVRADGTVVDDSVSELERIYESLEVFDGGDVDDEKVLRVARYLVSDGSREIGTLGSETTPARIQDRFDNVTIDPPRIEGDDEAVRLRYFTYRPTLECGGPRRVELRRHDVEISTNYDVDVETRYVDRWEKSRPVDGGAVQLDHRRAMERLRGGN